MSKNKYRGKQRLIVTGTCLATALLCMPPQAVYADIVGAVEEATAEDTGAVYAANNADIADTVDAADEVAAAGAGAETQATQTGAAQSAQAAEPPALETVSTGYDSVAFAWNEIQGVVSYEVQQSEDKKTHTSVAVIKQDQADAGSDANAEKKEQLSYTATGLFTGKNYYFRVIAVRADGSRLTSVWHKVKPTMSVPQVTRAQGDAMGQANLAWTAVEGAAFYRVYRSTAQDGGYELVKSVYDTAYTGKMSAGVDYYYKIMPMRYNPDGKKVRGTCSAVQTLRSTEEIPVISSVSTAADNGLTVSWNGIEGAEHYAVYRSTVRTSGYKLVTETGDAARNWTDTDVDAGTKYYYKVCAGKTVNGSLVYGSKSKAVSKWTRSPAPTNLKATQNDGKGVSLQWSASKAAASYNVYRAQGDGSSYTQIAKKVTGCSYTDKGLAAGETYYYRVEAVHGSLISDRSAAASVQIGSIQVSTRTLYLGPGVKGKLSESSELDGTVSYSSADESIATVSQDGTVTGVAAGKTQIDVSVGGVTTSVDVTVTTSKVNGIDVSKWQQAIDWKTVKASGIQFAMLRLTHGASKDIQFENYYQGATEQGIPVGVYCYSLAKSVAEGTKEAENLIELLDGRELGYPVALDLEDNLQIKNMNKTQRTQLILEYKRIVEEAGYEFIVYANLNWLNNYIDQTKLRDNDVDIWIARYRSQSLGHGYTGGGNVRLWQYSSSGQVDGILDAYGRYINVDLDVCYDGY